ncbi:MAG: Fic family protein, partial [Planctomycetia bacterium]
MPKNVSAVEAWVLVSLLRKSQFRELPIAFESMDDRLRYWIPPRLVELLHFIDLHAGGMIDGPTNVGALNEHDRNRVLLKSLMDEAIASSQLEGATTTREAAKKMLRSNAAPRDRAERMIFNNYQAISEIRELKHVPLTVELIQHLQEVITDKTLDKEDAAGRFRRPDEKITVADMETGETLFTPPDAATIDERIQELCDFANDDSGPFLHPVVKAVALHFAVGFIHPFVDGNGRTARSIFYWYMLKKNYGLLEFLPISRLFLRGPKKYATAYLYTETDGGDLTYFLHYNLTILRKAIEELHGHLERVHAKAVEAAKLLEARTDLNPRQASLLNDLLRGRFKTLSVTQHQHTHGISNNTARSDLNQLATMGLLVSL